MKSLQERCKIYKRRLISDERGWFLKAIDGMEDKLPNHTGEIYLTMGKPGQSKGGHYHPKAVEWFTIIQGSAILKLQDIQTLEYCEIEMSLDHAITVFVPNNVAHTIENNSNENFILLAYTDLLYDPEDTIKYEFKNDNRYF